MENYFIKEGYKCNLDSQGKAIPFFDDEYGASAYQVKVYEFTRKLICKYKIKSVLDLGCGFGSKLIKTISPVCNDIVGIDRKHAIDFCKQKHSFGRWFEDDIEKPKLNFDEKFDLIIASDVIEHLVDPDSLLNYIKRYSQKDTHIIVSTPARDLLRSHNFGPPLNMTHVREWSRPEFSQYISKNGFVIKDHFLLGERGLNLYEILRKIVLMEPFNKIQVVHCKKFN